MQTMFSLGSRRTSFEQTCDVVFGRYFLFEMEFAMLEENQLKYDR